MANKKSPMGGFSEALFCTAAAVLLIILHTVVCFLTDVNPLISGSFICALYIAFVAAFFVIRRNILSSKKISPMPEALNVLSDAVVNLPRPVVICPAESDRIIWYNKTAWDLFGKKNASFSEIFSTLEDR
ncbi:MAG: hypothetical protein PUC29_06410, partial [Clostridia bacterium]|nr:hypothetical protein [Clostridia bacterium]